MMGEPITLDYPLRVLFAPGMEQVLIAPAGAEVFMDEFDVQWIKFLAANGPHAGRQHIIRTEGIVIVRD
jgi:hypothetical protein